MVLGKHQRGLDPCGLRTAVLIAVHIEAKEMVCMCVCMYVLVCMYVCMYATAYMFYGNKM